MKTTRGLLWVVLLGILLAGVVAGPYLWAAPGQYPDRQTVPSKTPKVTATPEPTSTPKPKPKKPSPTATPDVASTVPLTTPEATPSGVASVPLLPGAGGRSIGFPLAVATIVAGFLVLAVARRRE